jgi:hypothetical protein
MRRTRQSLLAHLGGNASATQAAMIDRACFLTLYLARMDAEAVSNGGVHSDHKAKQYLAYSNSLTRTLGRLGLEGAPPPTPTLQDILAKLPGRTLPSQHQDRSAA